MGEAHHYLKIKYLRLKFSSKPILSNGMKNKLASIFLMLNLFLANLFISEFLKMRLLILNSF